MKIVTSLSFRGECRAAFEFYAKVLGGKITAAEVAQKVFKAISADQFYVFSHESPKALGNITHRMQNIVAMNNPADPFLETPEIGVRLRAQLRAGA